MQIKVLMENTPCEDRFVAEHGLSFLLSTDGRTLLFDTGATDGFLKNAAMLGLDLSEVTDLFISHGHYDHGGGLKSFLNLNEKAKVYVHTEAFERCLWQDANGNLEYIGLDSALTGNDRFVLTKGFHQIDPHIWLFSDVPHLVAPPSANAGLLIEEDGQIRSDSFRHEQNLVIEEGDKTYLFTGCAHNGIINIIRRFEALKGKCPDFVIGGFLLEGLEPDKAPHEGEIASICQDLLETKADFYTGHCTGLAVFSLMKRYMGDKVHALTGGLTVSL